MHHVSAERKLPLRAMRAPAGVPAGARVSLCCGEHHCLCRAIAHSGRSHRIDGPTACPHVLAAGSQWTPILSWAGSSSCLPAVPARMAALARHSGSGRTTPVMRTTRRSACRSDQVTLSESQDRECRGRKAAAQWRVRCPTWVAVDMVIFMATVLPCRVAFAGVVAPHHHVLTSGGPRRHVRAGRRRGDDGRRASAVAEHEAGAAVRHRPRPAGESVELPL